MTGGGDTMLWAPQAWIDGQWAHAVRLQADRSGQWTAIEAGTPAPAGATLLPGPVLPGLVDAHSHAFQRAFAGMAERREGEHDDFWSWRDRMYGVAGRITPGQLRAVATQLYAELLAGGFTQVCEFHYLHHEHTGSLRGDPMAMCQALMQAAADTGIGLTLLPVLYERAGFDSPGLRPEQQRFQADAAAVLALRDGVRALGQTRVSAGVAIHSLRAAPVASLRDLLAGLGSDPGPIHIHIAEQAAEVQACEQHLQARPIEWLAREFALDARWQLVHATHAKPGEIEAVAASGAGVVLCPSTEANLGDGLCDLPRWLAAGTPLSLGTDSHVGRGAAEELRWLEYGQRLIRRERNVAADPSRAGGATAARLFERVLAGGAAAAGLPRWGLRTGARADLVVLDPEAPGLLGMPATHALDAWVFAGNSPAVSEVWVAGQRRVARGVHVQQAAFAAPYVAAMASLYGPQM